MRGASGDGAGDGAYGQPFGGSGYAPQGTSPFGDTDGFVAFAGQDGGLGALVGQVALSRGQFGLADPAIQGEVVQRLEVFLWD